MPSFWSQYRWSILKSLPVGVFLPVTFFLGSVGPDDFSRNYAGWAKTFGLTEWADWLARYATSPRVFWAVVLITFLYLAVAFGLPFLIRHAQRDTAVVAVPLSVALIIIVGCFFGYETVAVPIQRHLTTKQKEELASALAPLPKFSIFVFSGTGEEARYAHEFVEIFKKVGYSPEGPFTGFYAETEDEHGVMVGVRDPSNPSPAATDFINALAHAGLRPRHTKWASQVGTGDYDLFIGPP